MPSPSLPRPLAIMLGDHAGGLSHIEPGVVLTLEPIAIHIAEQLNGYICKNCGFVQADLLAIAYGGICSGSIITFPTVHLQFVVL